MKNNYCQGQISKIHGLSINSQGQILKKSKIDRVKTN